MGSAMQMVFSGADHIRKQSSIDAARITTASGNVKRAAQSELMRYGQEMSNKRIMKVAGEQANALAEGIAANLDAATYGELMEQVSASEEVGALMAQAAAAGVGGSTIDTYQRTMRLNNSMQKEQRDRALNSNRIGAEQQRQDVMSNAVASLDNSVYHADLDFSRYVDHKEMGGTGKLLAFATAAAATYYGGPQAGAAVLDTYMAADAMNRGDVDMAANKGMNAVTNGVAGMKTYTSAAPKGKAGEAWGKGAWGSTKKALSSIKFK